MIKQFENLVSEHKKSIEKSFSPEKLEILEKISREVLKAFKSGHKLMLCGNGGSASDAQHIAAEFIGRFKRERQSLPAIALTTDTSIITALANDYNYDIIFARQVEGLGHKGDVLIAISTSGNSKNVLEAARKAKEMGISVIGFTGQAGGRLKELVDICYTAEAAKTPHVQEIHITALHAISEVVEDVLFGA